jgi:hypothetical protein
MTTGQYLDCVEHWYIPERTPKIPKISILFNFKRCLFKERCTVLFGVIVSAGTGDALHSSTQAQSAALFTHGLCGTMPAILFNRQRLPECKH